MISQVWNIPPRIFSPRSLLLAGFLFWLLIRLSIFYIDFGVNFSQTAIMSLVIFVSAFVLGTYIVDKWFKNRPEVVSSLTKESQIAALRLAANILLSVTFVFLVLRFYDLLTVRKLLEYGGNSQLSRMMDSTNVDGRSTGGISFISGIGFSIAVPTIVFAVAFRRSLTRFQFRLAVILFIVFALYVVLSGARYTIIAPLFLVVISYAISSDGLQLSWKKIGGILAIIGLAFVFITAGTEARDRLYGTNSSVESLSEAPTRMNFRATESYLNWFSSQDSVVQSAIWGWVGLAWYINHGMYEYQKLIDYSDPSVRQGGVTQFSVVFYFFRVVGLTDVEDNSNKQLPTFGVYYTFFGPAYLDFGVLGGGIFMIILGAIAQYLWLYALRLGLFSTLMYPFFGAMIFNFPINNLISNGNGVPVLAMTVVAYYIVYSSGVVKLKKCSNDAKLAANSGTCLETDID